MTGRRALWAMFGVAVVVSAVLVQPYLSLDAGNSRIAVSGTAHYAVLVAHIVTATVALVLGPLQFIATIRARRGLHRRMGRIYLLGGVLPSAITAVPVAVWSGRALTQVSLTIAAGLWLITGGLAYRAARRRDFVAHRAWMMRNYALTFLAVSARVVVPLLLLSQVALGRGGGGTIADNAQAMIPVGQTAGWIINLVVAETLIRRRRPSRQRGAG